MAYICLKCGNVTDVLAEGGRCPMCGAIVATKPRAPRRDSFSETRAKTPVVNANTGTSFQDVTSETETTLSPSLGNLCIGLFAATLVTYPLGIFLPLATVHTHMDAKGAFDTAEETGSDGFLIKLGREIFDFFGENPTIVDEFNTFSLVSGLGELLSHGQVFLFLLILVFSILFPVSKMASLGYIAFYDADEKTRKRQLKWLATFGKWSMLDVFVIALMVVALKLGDMVNVEIHAGLYFFAASVLLTMVLTHLLHKTYSKT